MSNTRETKFVNKIMSIKNETIPMIDSLHANQL